MAKLEIHIPMLGKSLSSSQKPKDMKDVDEGKKTEKAKRKEIQAMQPMAPAHFGMTAGNMLPPKPSHKEMHEDRVHSEVRQSMADWVAGRKSTKEHKETVRRAKGTLSARAIREGGY
jgi:hypothetical protein